MTTKLQQWKDYLDRLRDSDIPGKRKGWKLRTSQEALLAGLPENYYRMRVPVDSRGGGGGRYGGSNGSSSSGGGGGGRARIHWTLRPGRTWEEEEEEAYMPDPQQQFNKKRIQQLLQRLDTDYENHQYIDPITLDYYRIPMRYKKNRKLPPLQKQIIQRLRRHPLSPDDKIQGIEDFEYDSAFVEKYIQQLQKHSKK